MTRREALRELNLEEGYTPEDLKKAYRKRSMETHPDRGGDEESFKRVNSAKDTLEKKEQRNTYRSGFWGDDTDYSDFTNSDTWRKWHRGDFYNESEFDQWDTWNDGFKRYKFEFPVSLTDLRNGAYKKIYIKELNESVEFEIPRWSKPETVIKLYTRSGKKIYITLKEKPSKSVEVLWDSCDVIVYYPCTILDMLLGTKKKFKLFGEEIEIEIPQQSDSRVVYNDMGWKDTFTGLRADLIIHLNPIKKTDLTEQQINEISEIVHRNPE